MIQRQTIKRATGVQPRDTPARDPSIRSTKPGHASVEARIRIVRGVRTG